MWSKYITTPVRIRVCIGHKESRAASLPRSAEDVNVHMNVMYNMRMWMYVWMWCIIWMCAIAMYYNEIFAVNWWEATQREKTLGETWAAVIKTINSILRTSVASNCALPWMGTEPELVYGQKGTMKDVIVRCLKKTKAQVCTLSLHACCL